MRLFSFPVARPRRMRPGGELSEQFNRLADAVQRADLAPRVGVPPFFPLPSLQAFQAQITLLSTDSVVCRTYAFIQQDPLVELIGTVEFEVALPWLLRRTPFDGVIYNGVSYTYSLTEPYTRTATAGPDSETQRITPPYVVGDVLYVLRNVTGGTGVTQQLQALDLNVDGRCWAAEQL